MCFGKGKNRARYPQLSGLKWKRQNITSRSPFLPGVSGSHDLPPSDPSPNLVAIARPDEATQPSLTCQGRRRGHDQLSLMLSGTALDRLPCMHHLHYSGTLGALPMAATSSPYPTASPFPVEAAVYNSELKWRLSSLHRGGELQLEPPSGKKKGESGESWYIKCPQTWQFAPPRVENTHCLAPLTQNGQALHNALPRSGTNTRYGCQVQSGLRFLP